MTDADDYHTPEHVVEYLCERLGRDMVVPPRSDHHEDCNKQWRGLFDDPIPARGCPTCRALAELDGATVYEAEDLPIVERLYAGRGWTANVLEGLE